MSPQFAQHLRYAFKAHELFTFHDDAPTFGVQQLQIFDGIWVLFLRCWTQRGHTPVTGAL
eukprot:647357-Karenia_brevis.AAC.1